MRILLFRQPASPDAFEESLRAAGWSPVSVPVISFRPVHLDQLAVKLRTPERYAGLICTSQRASEAVAGVLSGDSIIENTWSGKPAYVTGDRTAEPLPGTGLEPRGMHSGGAKELAEILAEEYHDERGRPLLFVCGNNRRDELPDALRERKIPFEELVVYESERRMDLDLETLERPHWVVFFSPMGVETVCDRWPDGWEDVRKAAIGETTAAAIRSAGWTVDAVASRPNAESLSVALLKAANSQPINQLTGQPVKFDVQRADLPGGRGSRYVVLREGRPLSYGEVIEGWRLDEAFRSTFIAILSESPYAAFRWETPPVTNATLGRTFEFVLIDAPELIGRADRWTFASHFGENAGIVVFENLGGDALLVAPSPAEPESDFAHLGAFTRSASAVQNHALWSRVGKAMKERLGDSPIWLNTAGDGVAWLHVRLDARPKYYRYQPYRFG